MIKPLKSYRFLKNTHFLFSGVGSGMILGAGNEIKTDSQCAANIMVREGVYSASKGIPKYVLESWLEDGRIEEVGLWKPKVGEEYFSFVSDGAVIKSTWVTPDARTPQNVQEKRHAFGNVFKTKAEAERARDVIKEALTTAA